MIPRPPPIHTPQNSIPTPLKEWHVLQTALYMPRIEVNKYFFLDIWKEKHFYHKFPQWQIGKKRGKIHGKENGHSRNDDLLGSRIQPHQNIMFATSVAFSCLPICFFPDTTKDVYDKNTSLSIYPKKNPPIYLYVWPGEIFLMVEMAVVKLQYFSGCGNRNFAM